ncbi:MAG: hypothetical protein K2L86_06975 [Lachnospiraceae bacterium]|nr:hypothetical protein [Lachnospiraceae bacterium]
MRKILNYVVLAVLFPALLLSTVLLAYLHFFAPGDNNLSGKWTAALDMTDQAAVTAFSWLQEIEGISVSMQEVEASMGDLTIEVNMIFEETARSKGTFESRVTPESYETCSQAAYEAFAVMFREAVSERLQMAGYDGRTDQEAVEALVTETFGMSTVSYLMSSVPKLLPSLEELQAQYDGSGTYQTAEGTLTRQFDGGEAAAKAEYYVRKDASLILTGERDAASQGYLARQYPIIYTLQ